MDIRRNPDSGLTRKLHWGLLSGLAALLLVAVLFLTLVRFEARALSAEGSYTDSPMAQTAVITSQIRSPNRDAYITQRDPLSIEGIAWVEGSEPPYVTGDVFLQVQRVTRRAYLLTWNEVPAASQYLVEESSDAEFSDPDTICFGPTTQCAHTGSDGTFYYRVKAIAAGVEDSRWSNVVSVTVPWLDATAGTLGATASEGALAASSSITVQVRIDDGDWYDATVTETPWGTEWSYEWSLPEERNTQHTIHSRAAGEEGDFGPVDTITVTVDNQRHIVYLPLVLRRWPPVPYAPTLAEIVNPQHRVSYTLNWSYDGRPGVPDPTSYTLQEATDPAFSDPNTYSTAATQLTIQDPAREKVGGTYYYRVRGYNQYGPGPWSTVRSTTVRVVPYAPTLHEIANPDRDDSYTVSWSYAHEYPAVNSFILQEATNPNFSGAVSFSLDANTTSYDFTDKGNQTYYYRVRGRNAYGDGPWSAVRSVVSVSGDFYDDFTDPTSGWRTHQARSGLVGCDDGGLQQNPDYKYSLYYEGGKYKVHVPVDCRAGGRHGDTRHIYPLTFAPGVERPTTTTCVQARGAFERYETFWSFWGLVFAASEDKSTLYSLEVNDLGAWAVLKRTGYDFPGPNHPFQNEVRHELISYGGGLSWPARPAFEANTLRAEVEGNNVKLFINGRLVHSFSDGQISSLKRVGLIGGVWEITPTQIGYDYFYLDEGCDSF